jgi:hypothetical protein
LGKQSSSSQFRMIPGTGKLETSIVPFLNILMARGLQALFWRVILHRIRPTSQLRPNRSPTPPDRQQTGQKIRIFRGLRPLGVYDSLRGRRFHPRHEGESNKTFKNNPLLDVALNSRRRLYSWAWPGLFVKCARMCLS